MAAREQRDQHRVDGARRAHVDARDLAPYVVEAFARGGDLVRGGGAHGGVIQCITGVRRPPPPAGLEPCAATAKTSASRTRSTIRARWCSDRALSISPSMLEKTHESLGLRGVEQPRRAGALRQLLGRRRALEAQARRDVLLQRALHLQHGEHAGGARRREHRGSSGDAPLHGRRRGFHEAGHDRLVRHAPLARWSTRPLPAPPPARASTRRATASPRAAASRAPPGGSAHASPRAPPSRESVPNDARRDEVVRQHVELAVASPPHVVLGRVTHQRCRQGAVARVAQHRVHQDRRVSHREKATLSHGPRDRQQDVGLPLPADHEHRRQRLVVQPRRVVGHDASNVTHCGMRARRLGDRQRGVVAQHLCRAGRQGYTADAEAREKLVAGAVVVEKDDPPSRPHEQRKARPRPRALRGGRGRGRLPCGAARGPVAPRSRPRVGRRARPGRCPRTATGPPSPGPWGRRAPPMRCPRLPCTAADTRSKRARGS